MEPEHTLYTERDKLMQSCLTEFPHERLMGRSTQEHSSSVEHQPSQGEDEEIPHSGRMNNLRSSKSKGMETAWLVRSCGKKKIILDGEEYKKPITEYRKPSGRTDNLRSSRNY